MLEATPDKPSPVIGIQENKITRQPLMEAVKKVCGLHSNPPISTNILVRQTQEVAKAIAEKDFTRALGLRDPEFEDCLHAFRATTRLNETYRVPEAERMRIAIIQ